ncbi:MAG: chromosomal replication initiator protein DnaA [Isosphaeraceae bacterium]
MERNTSLLGSIREEPDHRGDPSSVECALRAAIAQKLGESRYGLWFGEGVQLAIRGDGDTLDVRVPSAFFREWIQTHFSGSLVEAAALVTGRRPDLRFSLREESDAAPSGRLELDADPRGVVPGCSPSPAAVAASAAGRASDVRPRRPAGPNRGAGPAGRSLPFRESGAAGRGDAGEPPSPIRAARRLDNFVVGSCNRLACAAAQELVQSRGAAFNPLVIHGGVGLGKTHLLEAVAHGLRERDPGANVLLVTAESFTNGFLEAMRNGSLASFRHRHRRLGALAMDDVHFLAGTRATQNEFLHMFNALVDSGAPIVVTADQHPRRISKLSDELVTRFLGGMVVKLDAPDRAARRAILQAKSEARGVAVPAAVLDYIAEHLRSSVRELEGALHSVLAHSLLTGKRLDLALARSALRDTLRHTANAIGLRDVEQAVCQLFQVDPEALKSNSRARNLSYPRMLAVYLARKHTGAPYSEIGRYFGGRNHSTIISAEKKVQGWIREEAGSALLPGFETVSEILADLERALSC